MGTAPPDDADLETDLTSRSDLKRARRTREDALARLSNRLCSLSEAKLHKLGLPDDVLDAVLTAQHMKSNAARGRQLRVVRSQLRGNNWPEVVARLETLEKHGSVSASAASNSEAEAKQWVVKLVGGGTPALDELLSLHPQLDRKHLRTLIRNAAVSSGDRRARAEEKLARTLEPMLR
ncbi:MAG: ribosome biogenesis factor YjgA [Polyangiaceae bacterium]